MKDCPQCAEPVREAARICRFCGHRFGEDERAALLHARQVAGAARRRRGAVGGLLAAVLVVAGLGGLLIVLGASEERQASERASASADKPRSPADAQPPVCSESTVAEELRRRQLLDRGLFIGVQDLACRDFTDDGVEDAAFVRTSTGNEGTTGWGLLVGRRDGGWDLPVFRPDEVRVRVEADGSNVVRREPRFLPGDANCCPSGGTEVEVYEHKDGTFVIARSYIEGGAGGAPTDAGEQADGAAEAEQETEGTTSAGGESEDPSLEPCVYGDGQCTPEENVTDKALESYCGGPDSPEC